MKQLAQVRDALARGEIAEAFDHAVAAWRTSRATEYADLVHALRARLPELPVITGANGFKRWKKLEADQAPLDVTRQVGFLRDDGRQKVWREGLVELAKRAVDPVLARELALSLAGLPWRSTAAIALYSDALALIATGATASDAEPLRTAIANLHLIDNAKMRATVHTLLEGAVVELERHRPAADPAFAEVSAALVAYDQRIAGREARTAELLDAVYANLADDGPRLVLADHLAEVGDPRGELIALQCQGGPLTAKQQARVRHLVDAHGKAWLGELGERSVLKDGLAFERGFVAKVRVRLYRWSDRPRTIGNRIWSTVRDADLATDSVADELLDPVCVSLRILTGVNGVALDTMLQHNRPLPLEVIGLDYSGDDRFAALTELGERHLLPNLRELYARAPRTLGPLRTALAALPPLDRIYIEDQPGSWRELLGPKLRELVCTEFPFVYRITRDDPRLLDLSFGDHGWERLAQLVELPGITKMIIRAEPTTCERCKRNQATAGELEKRFGCAVELA